MPTNAPLGGGNAERGGANAEHGGGDAERGGANAERGGANAERGGETAPAGTSEDDGTACGYTSYDTGAVPEEYPKTGDGATGAAAAVWDALYEVEDPEMPVSVVDLGLIYDVRVEDGHCDVEMTLTYTGCPAKEMILNDVRCAAETAPGVTEAEVRLRYTPEWTVDMMTRAGREDLREFGLSV